MLGVLQAVDSMGIDSLLFKQRVSTQIYDTLHAFTQVVMQVIANKRFMDTTGPD
jgi:hypothetical protein